MSLILAAAVMVSGAIPPSVPPTPPSTADAPIVVEGRRAAAVRSYVAKLAKPVANYQLARWRQPICLEITGVDAPHAAFVRRRIESVAMELHIGVAGQHCWPNVGITVTDIADQMTDALIARRPRMFGPVSYASEYTRPLRASELAVLRAPRPVRWFASSTTRGPDGQRVNGANMLYSSSKLRPDHREDIETSIVIVDATKIETATWDQLADYLIIVTLAQPDMAADYADTDSILSLFASPADAPAGLTDQDWAFLRALQKIDSVSSPSLAQATIRDHMLNDTSNPAPRGR